MERATKNRYYHSIAASLFIFTLHLNLIQTALAAEASEDLPTTIALVDSKLTGSLGTHKAAHVPSTQRETQVEDEVLCLALNIYFEARSEAEQGQRAVGHVVMNRVANRHYPSTVCNVIQQGGEERLNRCQFSWWCDGRSDKPSNQKAWLNALQLAITIYFGDSEDPTNGALWYHAEYVNPYWSDTLTIGGRIGKHIFYLKKKQPKYALN